MSAAAEMLSPLLEVNNLSVEFTGRGESTHAVRSLSYQLGAAETLGIVGESGSGKTQSVMSLLGLLPDNARVSGSAVFEGRDLLAMSDTALSNIRGNEIAMIFQDPMTALNPHLTVAQQMAMVAQRHLGSSQREARATSLAMLDAVRIPEANRRLNQYPHELSGGMRQRIMIATALLCRPKLLIADEPTTALDVTVQAQILKLMQELQQEFSASMLLITHDMGVVAGCCDNLLVMSQGECVESGNVDSVFNSPQQTYTRELLAAVPRLDVAGTSLNPIGPDSNSLSVTDLNVTYPLPHELFSQDPHELKALRGVSFELAKGETLGVVGESGCGKSTLAKGVLQLVRPAEGSVVLLGESLGELSAAELRQRRSDMQVVFQDPLASLNPRMTIAEILCEPLDTFNSPLSAAERRSKAAAMLEKVGLSAEHLQRYPHEFSGGQCQRIGIARALMFEPQLIVCDEPVSALDVSVQAKIVELLISLQKELGISLIFVAHDLAVVRQMSHRVMVMYLGKVVELADRNAIYEQPLHPYTRALIDAVPLPDPALQRARGHKVLAGDLPSPLNPPAGCAFSGRCPRAESRCTEEEPKLRQVGTTQVACHFAESPGDLPAGATSAGVESAN